MKGIKKCHFNEQTEKMCKSLKKKPKVKQKLIYCVQEIIIKNSHNS